jgi:hypothetical protein
MQQYVLIAAGLALALGGLVAMFLSRPRPGDGPPPITDPYEELYSDLRGEVVARPLGEPHAGVNRQERSDNGAPSVGQSDTVTAEFGPAPASAGADGREPNRTEGDSLPWRDQDELEEPLSPAIREVTPAQHERYPPSDRPAPKRAWESRV